MPYVEVMIRKKPVATKESSLMVIDEKGGVYMTQVELEWIRFAETEYERAQEFLKKKLYQQGKSCSGLIGQKHKTEETRPQRF